MVFYGQVVVGPPASGKSTYCAAMEALQLSLQRPCVLINLDFANDHILYTAHIDARELITIETVMDELHLGPNGGLMYCMEYLLAHIDWLIDKLTPFPSGSYLLFDLPGQVELVSHHTVVQELLKKLIKKFDMRLCSVYLVDTYYCTIPMTFISAVLLATTTMLRLGLPHINVLSKVDLLRTYGADALPFNLDFFTEITSLTPLVAFLNSGSYKATENKTASNHTHNTDTTAATAGNNDSDDDIEVVKPKPSDRMRKYHKMATGICEVLEDMSLVHFLPMNIQDLGTVMRVLRAIDKANGYSFAALEAKEIRTQLASAGQGGKDFSSGLFKVMNQDTEPLYFRTRDIQERYSPSRPAEADK